ncbi:MAG: GspH/FimT family protein [Chromatiaceae bacterium]|nr:GspH/FimT family protein [Chromatiaceae bacterium]
MGLTAAKTEAIRQNASIRFCLDPEALTWRVMTTASIDLRVGTLPANLTAAHANLDTTAVDDHACVRFRPNGLSYGTGNALMTNGSITLTTQGKNRAVNVRTGAFDVAGS